MKNYIGIKTAAAMAGLSDETIRRYTLGGKIPHARIGKLFLFDPDEIEAWIRSHRVPTNP